MFDRIPDFVSVNQLRNIRPGTYSKTCSEYQNAAGNAAILLTEYRHEFEASPCVVDLLVIDKHQFVRAADFIQIPSGQWRSSSGQVAATLGELMPPELDSFRLVEESKAGDIHVADGRFYVL